MLALLLPNFHLSTLLSTEHLYCMVNLVLGLYAEQKEEKYKLLLVKGECILYGPNASNTESILNKVLTFSTSSVVKGPPYLSLAKSNRVGLSIPEYVKALRCRGYLFFF